MLPLPFHSTNGSHFNLTWEMDVNTHTWQMYISEGPEYKITLANDTKTGFS